MAEPITQVELLKRWRAKFPGAYDTIDDSTLTEAIFKKYPVYKEQVIIEPPVIPDVTRKKVDIIQADAPIESAPPDVTGVAQEILPPQQSIEDLTAQALGVELPQIGTGFAPSEAPAPQIQLPEQQSLADLTSQTLGAEPQDDRQHQDRVRYRARVLEYRFPMSNPLRDQHLCSPVSPRESPR